MFVRWRTKKYGLWYRRIRKFVEWILSQSLDSRTWKKRFANIWIINNTSELFVRNFIFLQTKSLKKGLLKWITLLIFLIQLKSHWDIPKAFINDCLEWLCLLYFPCTLQNHKIKIVYRTWLLSLILLTWGYK